MFVKKEDVIRFTLFESKNINGTEPICFNCTHFRLHYIKWGESFAELIYGHCVYPRCKKRMCDTPACEHYNQRK